MKNLQKIVELATKTASDKKTELSYEMSELVFVELSKALKNTHTIVKNSDYSKSQTQKSNLDSSYNYFRIFEKNNSYSLQLKFDSFKTLKSHFNIKASLYNLLKTDKAFSALDVKLKKRAEKIVNIRVNTAYDKLITTIQTIHAALTVTSQKSEEDVNEVAEKQAKEA